MTNKASTIQKHIVIWVDIRFEVKSFDLPDFWT